MDIREKVRQQYQALLTGDVALAVATTAPDWANDEAEGEPPACRIPGPAGLLATGAWMRAGFSDLRFVEHVSVADEQHVLSEITLIGTHTGPFTIFEDGRLAQVLPPTGRRSPCGSSTSTGCAATRSSGTPPCATTSACSPRSARSRRTPGCWPARWPGG